MRNPRLDDLMTYPFERLNRLLDGLSPPTGIEPIAMSLGEPRHAPPDFVGQTLADHAADWGRYPPTRGTAGFRDAVAGWLNRRYGLPDGLIEADRNVLPCAGTREALFMFALVAVPQQIMGSAVPQQSVAGGPVGQNSRPLVLVPNPLYHVYAGAAVMAGADPVFVPATQNNRFLPDFAGLPAEMLDRTALVYLCSPGNPQGMAASRDELARLIALAIEHDFILAVDECYSELYTGADDAKGAPGGPPAGALEAAAGFGARAREALEHVVVFNSLSKRSSAPGLRSGFVAGGAGLIDAFARLRNYASCQTPLPIITVAEQLWRDEAHVTETRDANRARFDQAEAALGGRYSYYRPDGGFFLWLDVGDGDAAARRLWADAGLRVLPGACLCPEPGQGGEADSVPGAAYIRLALVHEPPVIDEALNRLCRVMN
jgi:aspartate/methionine/tyrosine aminotransferase